MGADLVGQIIFIDQKEIRAPDRALGTPDVTGRDSDSFQSITTRWDLLHPIQHMSANAVLMQFPQNFAVINFVKCLREI